ncbi:MAG: hypothetical protein IAC55_07110 [Tyzzerella sp.]|uniref:Uncharacterized protein n=1 Tax=Candidatus Fimicola merdigallinarum TaxID=2840819 RepID=A0A9D9DWK1_9FIRM|nr:hypothetical protein [Candidatus Fimicola merdigallinarum]
MAFEIIKSIIDAESQGDSIQKSAIEEANLIKSQADSLALNMPQKTKAEAKAYEDELVKKAISDAEPKKKEILEDALKKCTELKASAESKIDLAVESVIRKVVGEDGNS